jgi:hypothetical protein
MPAAATGKWLHKLRIGRTLGVEMGALIAAVVVAGGAVKISGADVLLNSDEAQALAKVLHELATNAAKYGALSFPGGKVSGLEAT